MDKKQNRLVGVCLLLLILLFGFGITYKHEEPIEGSTYKHEELIEELTYTSEETIEEPAYTREEQILLEAVDSMHLDSAGLNLDLTPEEEKEYLQGYLKILRNEMPLMDYWDNGRTIYYKDMYLAGIPYREYVEAKDETAFPYGLYYADLDGDGAPELGIFEGCLDIIKYEPGDSMGKIIYHYGDAVQDASDFAGFLGTAVWWHYVWEGHIEDFYEFPNTEAGRDSFLSLEQGIESSEPYYKVTLYDHQTDKRLALRVDQDFYVELSDKLSKVPLAPKSLAELFGEELDETDPLLAAWEGPLESDYIDWHDANLPYADAETYAAIKAAYERVDFFGEYETGDTSFYEEYRLKFYELLQSEGTLFDEETGEEIPIAEIKDPWGDGSNGRGVTYALFDVDGDTLPELAVYQHAHAWYVIDYDWETESYSIWLSWTYASYPFLSGTRKVLYNSDWVYEMWQLDENGEIELLTFFSMHPIRAHETVYIVGMPDYADPAMADEITEAMKQVGFHARNEDHWYFRITERQFNELTADFWEAAGEDYDRWMEFSHTYEELFGDFMD